MSIAGPLEHVFIISLRNPGAAFANTLHSAGHIALRALRGELATAGEQPPFSRKPFGGQKTQASIGTRYSLVESPMLMNVSGPWVANVWKKIVREGFANSSALVVLHDDLELALGAVKSRNWTASHRGHNGMRSIHATHMKTPVAGAKWTRICIGIGRPESREKDAVSEFVLRKMSVAQRQKLTDATRDVLSTIHNLERLWATSPA